MTQTNAPDPQESGATFSEKKNSLLLGLAISLVTPLLLTFGLIRESEFFVTMIVAIGLSQLIYLIPLIIIFHHKKAKRTVQGLLIGGGIIFLINTACFGLIIYSLSSSY